MEASSIAKMPQRQPNRVPAEKYGILQDYLCFMSEVGQGGALSKLLELMRKLGADAKLAAAYERDPDAVMRRFGLSDAERLAMRNKDYEAIKQLSGLKEGQFATQHIIFAYDD